MQDTAIVTPTGSRTRRIAFIVVATLFGLLTGFGAGGFLALIGGWFPDAENLIHRNHDISWGIVTGVLLSVPFFALTMRPERKVAAMQQVLAVGLAFLLSMVAAMLFDVFAALPAVLGLIAWAAYPRAREVLTAGGVSRRLAGFTLAAGIPLLVYAFGQYALQRANLPDDEHAEFAHYASMGVLALALLFTGLVASLKKPGWRIPAWCAGIGTTIYGLASVIYPADVGSGGLLWGTVAIAGGVTFIVLAEMEARSERA